jgi:hypothetical protein
LCGILAVPRKVAYFDPGAVIRPESGGWHLRMPDRLDEEDWRAGRKRSISSPH